MKILKKIGIVLLAILLVLVIISFFLPSKVHVERSLEMKAKPEIAFALVNNLKSWEEWSPWHKIDPQMKLVYSTITEGANASYSWTSDHDKVGNGRLTILESSPSTHIKTQLNFGNMSPSYADFNFTPTADGVKVIWTMDADMGMNPVARYFGLMIDKMMGPDYEKGLAGIKELAEKVPEKVTIAGFDFEDRMIGAMKVFGIREKMPVANLTSANFSEWYGTIGKLIAKQKLKYAGAPMALYYSYDNATTDIEAAIPVEGDGKDAGKVKYHEIQGGRAIVVKFYGNYNGVEPVYNAAFEYIGKNGLKSNGPPMEIYITDPAIERDTSKWLTEIAFPVQ
jgi:effector-binding domain-containing protein